MNLSQPAHFLDFDADLNFHLDEPLTREDAISAAVRLYNSERLEYDPLALPMREPTEEDRALLDAADAMKRAILDNTDEMPRRDRLLCVLQRQ